MSASSSITRTEIVPLRMQQPTVLGTLGALVVFGQLGTVARRDGLRRGATIGSLSDDSDRWWPLPERRRVVAISLPKSPPQECSGTPTGALLPWSPPSGRPASGGYGFVLLRGQWCWSDGARAALSRCRPVAWRESSPGKAGSRVLPAGRRGRQQGRWRARWRGPERGECRGPPGGPAPAAGPGTRGRGQPANRPRTTGQGPERKVP